MTISVIIPTRDDARTLPQTLASVFSQDRAPDEIIVVNDGGADPAGFLDAEAQSRIRIVTLEQNRGVSAARNVGLAASTGASILLLDSDDLLCPDFLRLATDALKAHPQAGFCIGDALRCPHDQVEAAVPQMAHGRERVALDFVEKDALFDDMVANSGFYLPSFIVMNRANLVLSLRGELYETRLINGSDYQLFLRTALRHGAVRIREEMGIHRLRPGSLSKNKPRVWTCRYQSMDMLLDEDPVLKDRPRQRAAIVELRSGGARRAARLIDEAGDRAGARRILADDMSRHFSLKSAYWRLRLGI